MRIRDWILQAEQILRAAGRDSPRLTAELLVAHVFATDRLHVITHSDTEVSADHLEALASVLLQRKEGMPLAYITGTKEFFGIPLRVSPATLIPRPETETLVELVLADFTDRERFVFADLGCGSGNIGIALAVNRKKARGLLCDRSKKALAVAQTNCRELGLSAKLTLLCACFSQLPFKDNSLDVIVANPPYIGEHERHMVMEEVLRFEPHKALFSEDFGTKALQDIIHEGARCLHPGGRIYLEHGAEQGERVRNELAGAFIDVGTKKDLAKRERISYGTLR